MRVIAGKARRLPLKTLEGRDTRPTQDRIKETLFNILNGDLEGCRFLDLFSGSGGIGIEALSRGAREAVFIEHNRNASAVIRQNLEFTRLADQARLIQGDVFTRLSALEQEQTPFDIIFMDPPYEKQLEERVLRQLSSSVLADDDTLLIVESSLNTTFDYLEETTFQITREKKYKTNKHIFIRKKGN